MKKKVIINNNDIKANIKLFLKSKYSIESKNKKTNMKIKK